MIQLVKPATMPAALWQTLLTKAADVAQDDHGRSLMDAPYWGTVKQWDQEHPEVELRHDGGDSTVLLIIALDGWERKGEERDTGYWPTRGFQVRMSSNGVSFWTLEHFGGLKLAADAAHGILTHLMEAREGFLP